MLLRILDNHTQYVDQNKGKRQFLSLMTRIRATQTLGATLTSRGSYDRAANIYKRLIEDALKNHSDHFKPDRCLTLETALEVQDENAQDRAWKLRSAIDTVYDECLCDYNDVSDAMPPNLHTRIKDTINKASSKITSGDQQHGLTEYINLLKDMKNNDKYRDLISPAAKVMVNESLEIAESADDLDLKNRKLRESLDRVYNEVRLPEVYSPSVGPLKSRKQKPKDSGMLVVDFNQAGGSMFSYQIQILDDKCMGGSSHAQALLEEEKKYLSFHGNLARTNRGGFASFRILPTVKDELRGILKNTKAVMLEVMNLEKQNIRYKFQMANEAHLKSFNWQAEFIVEPDNQFHTVVIDVLSFWPTMFGHVLSSPGNVDFSKVDCLGILISHVTVDGKENPDFVEGPFGLAVRSIRLIKNKDDD